MRKLFIPAIVAALAVTACGGSDDTSGAGGGTQASTASSSSSSKASTTASTTSTGGASTTTSTTTTTGTGGMGGATTTVASTTSSTGGSGGAGGATSSTTASTGAGGTGDGTCTSPIVATNGFEFQGDNFAQYNDDLELTDFSCEDQAGSPDVVFQVTLAAGQTINVKNFGTLDLTYDVISGCDDEACLADFDGNPGAGSTEQTEGLTYTSTAGGTYYIVVESYDSTFDVSETYDLRFAIPVCGDGVVGPGEGCDDNNTTPGDGCSATCTVEPGFICMGSPSSCGPVPAASCAAPIVVSTNPFEYSGSDITAFGDDIQLGDSSCAQPASPPSGYDLVFSAALAANETVRVRELGGVDSLLHILTPGDGCDNTSTCAASVDGGSSTEEAGITYTNGATPQTVYIVVESYDDASFASDFDVIIDSATCGNGVTEFGEACDDGNTTAGDGCSSTCGIETPSALGTCAGTIVHATATGLPQSVPDDDLTGISVVINIPQTGTIQNMAMGFSATHGYDADLDIRLTGPDGIENPISISNGSNGDNYTGTVFVDSAATSIDDGDPPYSGLYQSETPFSNYSGSSVTGNWTLRVDDNSAVITGTVDAWDLAFCVTP